MSLLLLWGNKTLDNKCRTKTCRMKYIRNSSWKKYGILSILLSSIFVIFRKQLSWHFILSHYHIKQLLISHLYLFFVCWILSQEYCGTSSFQIYYTTRCEATKICAWNWKKFTYWKWHIINKYFVCGVCACVCVCIGCVIFYSWNSNFIKLWKYNYDVFTDIHLTNFYWLFIIELYDLVMLYLWIKKSSKQLHLHCVDGFLLYFTRNLKGKYCEKTFKCTKWYAVNTNWNKHQLNLCSKSPFINATPLI